MTRRPTSSTAVQLGGALVAVVLTLTAPAEVLAGPPTDAPVVSVAIDVSTHSCQTVRIAYRVEWQSMTPDAGDQPATIELLATPGEYFLTSATVDFGRKSDKARGKIRDELDRESGYFDHQTYPGLTYQAVVRIAGLEARSNTVAIPDCTPMSPTGGPAAGGTVVTVVGGGTFGGPPFTADTRVTIGDVTGISPIGVASDGSWLQFVAPTGPAATCVSVFTDNPGLPFPLPPFCYSS